MTVPNAPLTDAKRDMAAGDFAGALTHFRAVDLGSLEPLAAARVFSAMATCATALGEASASIAYHRAGLERLTAGGLLDPATTTADFMKLGLTFAVGAHDTARVKKYMRMMLGELPDYARIFRVSPLADALAWCRARGVSVQQMDAEQRIELPDGRGLGGSVSYLCDATWHAVIPEAEIVGGWDFVMSKAGEVLVGANYMPLTKAFPFMPHGYCEAGRALAHVWEEGATYVDADALFLSTPERHHYGHWLTEFLPRLRAWRELAAPRRRLAISAALPAKHHDLLTRFGVRGDDLVECALGRRYRFRSLAIVRAGRAEAPNPRDVRFLAGALGPGPGPIEAGKIFYMERDVGTRRPANMREVQAVFDDFGVRTVNPARLSLAAQEDMFKDAHAIVGAFGTELYCLYNMRPGATVIEFQWDMALASVYGPTCWFLGLKHHLIMCAKAEERGTITVKKDGNLIVDCAALRERLTALT